MHEMWASCESVTDTISLTCRLWHRLSKPSHPAASQAELLQLSQHLLQTAWRWKESSSPPWQTRQLTHSWGPQTLLTSHTAAWQAAFPMLTPGAGQSPAEPLRPLQLHSALQPQHILLGQQMRMRMSALSAGLQMRKCSSSRVVIYAPARTVHSHF